MKRHFKQYHESYFMRVLQTILIILKLNKIINWKWTYVLMPLWIYLTIVLMLLIMALFVDVRDRRTDKWN
jgi:hypothetical protein